MVSHNASVTAMYCTISRKVLKNRKENKYSTLATSGHPWLVFSHANCQTAFTLYCTVFTAHKYVGVYSRVQSSSELFISALNSTVWSLGGNSLDWGGRKQALSSPCICSWFPSQLWYSTVMLLPHFTILYCTVLYCSVLYCTGIYSSVLYHGVLYCNVVYFTIL